MPGRIIHSKPTISSQDKKSVLKTLNTGFVGQGKQVDKVNSFFCSLFEKETSFFVNSGTSAFFLALKGLDINEGEEVILPNYFCGSIYAQVKSINAIPVVVDTIAGSFFVSPETVLRAITPKTKAIVMNHPFGHFEPAVFELKKAGVPIIEDTTHSLFARQGKVVAGSVADITIASFGSTKFITSGTGGILSFLSKAHANEVEKLLDHDYNKFPASEKEIRFNHKLGDVNAALLMSKFKQIEYLIKKRIEIARKYYAQLEWPTYPADFREGSVYFRFFIRAKKDKANNIREQLREKSIDSAQGALRLISRTFSLTKAFPESEKIWSELISIPIYPTLKAPEVNRILKIVNALR